MICYICKKDKTSDCFTMYEPEMCCSGHMCGCMGSPVNPPICDECEKMSIEELNNKYNTI